MALTMLVPGADDITGFAWRLRRTGTDDEGTTDVVHEATGDDVESQVCTSSTTGSRPSMPPASWSIPCCARFNTAMVLQDQFAEALGAAGFADIEAPKRPGTGCPISSVLESRRRASSGKTPAR